jgi:3-hydroxymyristoyl/3-hydroxydecanoyl-(acyl carrier protein) dehydratase
MGDHFSAFTFVDRITQLTAGASARGVFAIPARVRDFPACLVAEAVGQLAAWVSMSRIDFRGRPVAALASETRFHRDVHPGDTLELGVQIDDCDERAVAYSGWARVGGTTAIELGDCLGPMLPMEDFDSPDAMRAHFAVLRAEGSPGGTFDGVDALPIAVTGHVENESVRANLLVPHHARFFADHFPRNPVFPGTLLLDSQIRLATTLAREVMGHRATPVPARMTHVKMRAFIGPGQVVEIQASRAAGDSHPARIALSARVEGKTVATARVEFEAGEDK